ncbi:hypothetical protein LX64_02631 [Chitinophaga skermanii]|uniref:Uncharacterized protein n=1 Tax=Chitinophaga skermanii TaxID=331697 RepID=A0A327QQ50_9BACT|nr:hypothetical protein [Chitinophaga skermanii]RAJ05473.1 hypothetical protein LX64_02631 [Chitinophaga skermanii]
MSLFDYPRINFQGTAFINVGTGNNDDYSGSQLIDFPSTPLLRLSDTNTVEVDESISPVKNTYDAFYNWAITPQPVQDAPSQQSMAGKSSDYNNVPNFKAAANTDTPVRLAVPGEWNYWGNMTMTFSDVKVTGVVTGFNKSTGKVTYDTQSELLNKIVTFTKGKPGAVSSALLCDSDPEGVPATQIFSDYFALYDMGDDDYAAKVYIEGAPTKASTRNINFGRNLELINLKQQSAVASAIFQHSVNVGDWNAPSNQNILRALRVDAKYMTDNNVQGFTIRYSMYRCIPTQVDSLDYQGNDFAAKLNDMYMNPDKYVNGNQNWGVAIITGTIGLWKKGELASQTMGRFMSVDFDANGKPYKLNTSNSAVKMNPKNQPPLGPITFQLDKVKKVMSMDVSNMIPQNFIASKKKSDVLGSVTNLNDLKLQISYQNPNGRFIFLQYLDDSIVSDALFRINGGIIDFDYSNIPYAVVSEVEAGNVMVVQSPGNNGDITSILLRERPYMIGSDQSIAYAEQNQTNKTYRSNQANPEQCIVRVYKNGAPLPQGQKLKGILYAQFPSTPNQNYDIHNQISKGTFDLGDGDPVTYNVANAGSQIFIIDPSITDPTKGPQCYSDIDVTNAFLLNLRVLPQDTEMLSVLNSPNPITWDYLYKNVLQNYHFLYPAMAVHLPFTEEAWSVPAAASYVRDRVSDAYWPTSTYMPRTRDLSVVRRGLITKWCNQIIGNK